MDKNHYIYLDNNATTQIDSRVLSMIRENQDLYGNASSMHRLGRQSNAALTWAKETVAKSLDADTSEIIFTSGASEANNTVFETMRYLIDRKATSRKKILYSSVEHPSIMEIGKYFKRIGYETVIIPVNKYGEVEVKTLKSLLDEDVLLVSVMMGNNEIGTINDIKALAKEAHKVGAYFHTDATQAIGKIKVKAHEMDVDYLSLTSHKFYGPKGIGCLYVKNKAPYHSLIIGGHQEDGRRAGTYAVSSIIGLGKAIEIAVEEQELEYKKLWKLREKLRKGIIDNIDNVVINGHPTNVLPGTLNVSFPHAEGESILLMLDINNIAVSTGSACASDSLEPSYILLACGVDVELAHGSIRFSLGRYNTEQEIDKVIELLPSIINRFREISTR